MADNEKSELEPETQNGNRLEAILQACRDLILRSRGQDGSWLTHHAMIPITDLQVLLDAMDENIVGADTPSAAIEIDRPFEEAVHQSVTMNKGSNLEDDQTDAHVRNIYDLIAQLTHRVEDLEQGREGVGMSAADTKKIAAKRATKKGNQ